MIQRGASCLVAPRPGTGTGTGTCGVAGTVATSSPRPAGRPPPRAKGACIPLECASVVAASFLCTCKRSASSSYTASFHVQSYSRVCSRHKESSVEVLSATTSRMRRPRRRWLKQALSSSGLCACSDTPVGRIQCRKGGSPTDACQRADEAATARGLAHTLPPRTMRAPDLHVDRKCAEDDEHPDATEDEEERIASVRIGPQPALLFDQPFTHSV